MECKNKLFLESKSLFLEFKSLFMDFGSFLSRPDFGRKVGQTLNAHNFVNTPRNRVIQKQKS